MGIWGVELYQNDTSLDVKDRFEDRYREGEPVEMITKQLVTDYADIMGDPCEEPWFWFALAETQWRWGVLLPPVKEQAIAWLQKGGDLQWWQAKKPALAMSRKEELNNLHQKLLLPQPPMKKPRKRRVYKCEWKIGDVFAYQLDSELAKEKGIAGRYLLIQKVDEAVWYPGHVVPIVYVKLTTNDRLPSCVEEYNRLEYVQTWFTRYEHRFFPIDGKRPQEDIAEKMKIHYEVDEYGFLPQFRIRLLNTSKKIIPAKLVYVGRFEKTIDPPKEFVPHSKDNIDAVSWEQFGETFETLMIRRYCEHNLRELEIYQRTTS